MINFLLVLGTQKSGTTWLSNQLRQHPQYQDCGIKEWRCINKVVPACMQKGGYTPCLKEISEDYWRQLKLSDKRKFAASHLDNYFSVQTSSIAWGENSDYRALGDITGANGLADSGSLAFFNHHARSVGFNLKPMYLLRDPVARHYSAVKMKFFHQNVAPQGGIYDEKKHGEALREFTRGSLNKNVFIGRTRYDLIIPKLENIYGKGKVFYFFTEDLEKEKAIDVFTDYLGLKRFDDQTMNGYPHVARNQSSINSPISERMKKDIQDRYSETYAFVNSFFGGKVPKSWEGMGN